MSAKAVKMRLDRRVLEEGLAGSLKLAGSLIMEGKVLVNDVPVTTAGTQVKNDAAVRLRGTKAWVSRGAHKLLTAVRAFSLDLKDKTCLDVGASTGGFTQVMLRHGASRVYSLDVGYGLLDWSLREDPRVVVMDRQNARLMTPGMFSPLPGFVASDASFISLKMILEPMALVSTDDAQAVVLVKPQFEADHGDVGEGGIVRDAAVQTAVVAGLLDFIVKQTPWNVLGAAWSGIKGSKGNIEYLLHLGKDCKSVTVDPERLVHDSHLALD